MIFVSVPVEVEAIRWEQTSDSYQRIEVMVPGKVRLIEREGKWNLALLCGQDGSQGWRAVPVGHWIAHWPGDQSDVWPIDHARFTEKYAPKETA